MIRHTIGGMFAILIGCTIPLQTLGPPAPSEAMPIRRPCKLDRCYYLAAHEGPDWGDCITSLHFTECDLNDCNAAYGRIPDGGCK
jgi:hypothetical protein